MPQDQAALPEPLFCTALMTWFAFASIVVPLVLLPYSPMITGTVPLALVTVCCVCAISAARFALTVAWSVE